MKSLIIRLPAATSVSVAITAAGVGVLIASSQAGPSQE